MGSLNDSKPEVPHVIFVGTSTGYLRELYRAYIESGFQVTALIPKGDPLWKSKKIKRKYLIPRNEGVSFLEFIENEKIFDELNGWFLWSSLNTLKAIANSTNPFINRQKLLNNLNPKWLKIVGSRTNQIHFFESLKIPCPESVICKDIEDLRSFRKPWPALIKSDFGGSGYGIRDFDTDTVNEIVDQIPSDNFPLIVQEKILGTVGHLDAYFEAGTLIFLAYSENVDLPDNHYSYFPSRRYVSEIPSSIVEYIERAGRQLSLSGPAGIAFMKCINAKEIRFIEFDVNPGIWHHSFSFSGFDLAGSVSNRMRFSGNRPTQLDVQLYDPVELLRNSIRKRDIKLFYKVICGHKIEKYGQPMKSEFSDRKFKIRLLKSIFVSKFKFIVRKYLLLIKKTISKTL